MENRWIYAAGIFLGNLAYALAVKFFILPAGLITGGSAGIGIFVNRLTGMPVSLFVLLFNTAMLVLGWLILGKKFALTTVASTFLFPLILHVLDFLFPDAVLSRDPMLCTVFAGGCVGISLALVIREGASTGGMDIPPLILHKFFGTNISLSMYFFDCLILLLQAVQSPPEMSLYGILLVLIYTAVLDRCLMLGSSRTEVKVISLKADEIRSRILQDLDRGVTVLYGEGGYSARKEEIILTVISNRQLPYVEKMIHDTDPEAFLIVSRVSEVRGRGFTIKKEYPEGSVRKHAHAR